MANKQSLPQVNLKGAELQQRIDRKVLRQYAEQEHNVGDENFNLTLVHSIKDAVEYQQKQINDDEYRLRASWLLNNYRQGLSATQNADDFENLATKADKLIQAGFDDADGKKFWREHGQKILDNNKIDTEKLREIKQREFGKNALNQLLFDAQNMIALADNGSQYFHLADERIKQSAFLSDDEKNAYRQQFYKNGILNLALKNSDEAENMRGVYLPNDEELKNEINTIRDLRLKSEMKRQDEMKNQDDFENLKQGILLWQKKEKGELDEASYYVLSKGRKNSYEMNDINAKEISDTYQMLRQINDGKKLSNADMAQANYGLVKAYKDGKISFDEVQFAQNFLLDKRTDSEDGSDVIISDLTDKILISDTDEKSDEAKVFMEEKAKLALKLYDVYYKKKKSLVEGVINEYGYADAANLYDCAHKASDAISKGFGFKIGHDNVSFSELKQMVHNVYKGRHSDKIWKEFVKQAPFSEDKKLLLKQLATAEQRYELNLPRFETWQEVKEAKLEAGSQFYFRGRLAVKA